MQRFRVMKVYLGLVIVLLALTIGGVSWFRRPGALAVAANEGPAAAGDSTTQPTIDAVQPLGVAKGQILVSIDNFTFAPKDLTVAAGTTVTWVNHDDVPHTATSTAGPQSFDSKALDTDEKYSFTFSKSGTYRYYCKVHPHMTASVVVR
jgi:plastocyanin